MIHLFINALSASAGGGLTYVRNLVPCLNDRDDVHTTLLIGEGLHQEMNDSASLKVLRAVGSGHIAKRFWHEQRLLPAIIRRTGTNVLLSTGNFALFRSPVPQILLSRNALYTSAEFLRDLRRRGDYRLWIDTVVKGVIARRSVQSADFTVAPSASFAADLGRWSGRPVVSIHHGFSRQTFFDESVMLPQPALAKLAAAQGALRILLVSHYNYYRNFETLIRAIAILKKQLHPQTIRLILTCKLATGENPGSYRAEGAAALVESLKLCEEVVELGSIPYAALHHLYRSCDFYVSPAYAETFAHPLVEAMASGLPVIASDLAVHREICGRAAEYFAHFSPPELADCILRLSKSPERKAQMRELGLARSRDFSWEKHVEQLLQVAHRLADANAGYREV
jgi:glycosyltransferase involved in cell wall biosynthesis